MMKRVLQLVIGCLFSMLMGSMAYAGQSTQGGSILYVIHAKEGQVVQRSTGNYQLVINEPRIRYFTDRPVRQIGKIDVQKFVADWSKGAESFAHVNPNAALMSDLNAINKGQQKNIERFVVLSNPQYTAPKQLTLDVKQLGNGAALSPMQLTNMALFIDNVCNLEDPPPGGCW